MSGKKIKKIPVICETFPLASKNASIYIQQDNGKSHLSVEDPDIQSGGN